ncbi:MAG TPA: TAXI family TRAP transporter solute-binding subunit, partial [Noviherbaspirillum sp.]
IPAGTYPGQSEVILTYGVTGTMVVKAEMPAEIVYQLVKSVFDNFEEFTELHPALAGLQPKAMIRDGLTAPLHEGAVRYYKERGWL